MVKYYAPGERQNNKTYIARGTINGRRIEFRTAQAKTLRAAEREWTSHVAQFKTNPRSALAKAKFRELAEAYKAARRPSRNDERYIDTLCDTYLESRKQRFGDLKISEIMQQDIWTAAHAAYPNTRNETKNRQAVTPAATILHFASHDKIIPHQVVHKLPEDEPETRRPDAEGLRRLLNNTEGDEHDFLVFLLAQGWRVAEALSLRWKHVDLTERELAVYVGKSKRWKKVTMHAESFELLANRLREDTDPESKVWPWKSRWRVYDWLTPLREKVKIRGTHMDFTPHQARHEWASQQNDEGGSDLDTVTGSTWTSVKSVKRYQTPSKQHRQRISGRVKLGKFRGKRA